VLRSSTFADEIDDPVNSDGFTFAIPPLRFTYVARTENNLCSIGQRHLDLNDGVLSTRFADKSFD
jgi:hypothetical protein